MNAKIKDGIIGAILLVIACGASVILHEGWHVIVATLLGYETSLGVLTLLTGSVFITGDMSAVDLFSVAIAGSAGLIVTGVLFVKATDNTYLKVIGVVFLSRAWFDVIPVESFDGGHIAASAGYEVAYAVLIIELVICGGVVLEEIQKQKI